MDDKNLMIALNLLEALKDLRARDISIYNLDLNHLIIDRASNESQIILGESLFSRTINEPDSFENLRYMSPEELQGKGRQLVSPFWVLGILLYELCFGRHPFANRNPKVMIQLIIKYPVYFPEERPISPNLE